MGGRRICADKECAFGAFNIQHVGGQGSAKKAIARDGQAWRVDGVGRVHLGGAQRLKPAPNEPRPPGRSPVSAASCIDGDRLGTMLVDDVTESFSHLIKCFAKSDVFPGVAHTLSRCEDPVVVMDAFGFCAALLTGVALGDFVLAIAANVLNVPFFDVHFNPAEDMAKTTEGFFALDHGEGTPRRWTAREPRARAFRLSESGPGLQFDLSSEAPPPDDD